MSLEVKKMEYFRPQALSSFYLWFLIVFVLSFVFMFSVCSASINVRFTNPKMVTHESSKGPIDFELTKVLQNIFEEGVKANHELTNPVEVIQRKLRRTLKHFRTRVENAHRINVHDASSSNHRDVFEPKSNGRHKRDVITADTLESTRDKRNISTAILDDPHVINKVIRVDKDIFSSRRMLDINVVDMMNEEKLLFTVEETGNGIYTIIYYLDKDFKVKQIKQIKTPSASTVEVTKINGQWYFLPVEGNYSLSTGHDPLDVGSHVYRFDIATNNVYKEQTIDTSYAKTALFWKGSGDEANTIYMAAVPQYAVNSKGFVRNGVNISCYHWQGGYLDYLFSVPASNPQSLTHFKIFDHDYLAVANYQDDTKSTTIYSEIFKYNHKESNYASFQKILTYGAKDIKHFRLSSGPTTEHFLAVANFCRKEIDGKCEFRLRSVIYKFSGGRFVPFQTIKTNGALQVLPLSSYGKFLLCMVELHGIKFLQYNGWNFVEKLQTTFDDPITFPNNIKLRSFVQNKLPHFSIASTQSSIFSGLYSFDFSQINSFVEKIDDLFGWCDKAVHILSSANTSDIYQKLLKAPKVNDEKIQLNGTLEFRNLRVNSLHSTSFEYDSVTYDGHFYKDMVKQFLALDILHKEMKIIENGLHNVVYKDWDRNQTVHGKVTFLDVEYHCPQITTNRANILHLNKFNLHEILPKLLYLSKNYSLDHINVENVIAKDSVTIPNLNGHPIFDYAIKNPGFIQKFTGQNTFLGPTKASFGFNVLGTLNGIHFTDSKIKFLLKQGNQTFTGPILLRNSTVKYLYTKYLNGADIGHYFREAVLKSGNFVITGNKKFSDVAVKRLFTENILSDVDVNDVVNRAIYLRGKSFQSFTGKQTHFQHLIVEDMVAGSPIIGAGHDLKHFVTVREHSEDYKIEQLTLSGGGTIHQLQVNQQLNNYGINANGRPDVLQVHDSEVQHVRHKSITALYFEKNVDAEEGTINGIHFPSWSNEHRVFLENNTIDGWMNVNGNLEVPAMIVKERFSHNESDVIHALTHIAHLDSKTLPGQCHIVFDSLKVKGNTHIKEKVNAYDPKQWLRRFSQEKQVISAPKVFLHDLNVLQNVQVMELYDLTHEHGRSENIISVIPDLLTYRGNQTIIGDVRFNGLLTTDNLHGKFISLDGVPLKNILVRRGDQNITVKSIFLERIEVREHFSVRNISAGMINEIDLAKAIKNTLLKTSAAPQIISGTYTFEKGFSIESMKSNGHVRNHNLSELLQGLVKIQDGVFHVNGTVVFKQSVTIEKLSYNGAMNGISDKDWGKSWLVNDMDQVVTTPVKFRTLKVENINVRNKQISGIDIVQLKANSIMTNEPSELHSITFSNDVKFLQGIGLSEDAKLNGHRMKNILKTESSKPQVFAGEVIFQNGFNVDGNVAAHSLGCLRLDLVGKFANGINKENYKFQKLVVIGNVTLEYEPEIVNSINDINWKEYLSDVWWTDRDMEINREVDFENVFLQNGIVLHRGPVVSGINLEELRKYYAGRSKTNEWVGEVFFKNGIFVHNNFSCGDIVFKNGTLFNDVDINELMNPNIVLMNGLDQTIRRPMTFSSLTADKIQLRDDVKVNTYNLHQDFMTIGGKNEFRSPKKFGEIIITNTTKFDSGTKISGVDMHHWKQHAVNKNSDYYFNRPMFFDQLKVNAMSVNGNVNSLKYSQDNLFLTTRPNQIVRGKVTIDGTMRPKVYTMNATEVIVQHTINGYNFNKSAANLVMKKNWSDTSPFVINGIKKFSGPVYVDQMKMPHNKLVYGENVTKIFHEISSFYHMPEHLKFPLNDRYTEMQKRITELQKYTPDQPVFMAHYEQLSYIQFPSTFTKVVHFGGYPLLSLGISKPQSIVETSHWSFNALQNTYVPYNLPVFQNHIHGCIVDFAEVKLNGFSAVITTNCVQNRPVQIDLPLLPINNNYELHKAEGKLNKAFILLRLQSKLVVSQLIYGQEFGKVLPFYLFTKNNLQSCIMIHIFDTENVRAEAFCFNENNVIYPMQSIDMVTPAEMSTMIVFRKTIIAMGDKDDKLKPEGVIDIWTYEDSGKLMKESCIPVINLVHLDSMWAVNYHPFLAVASGYVKGTRNFGAVYIYRYSTHKKMFEKIQTLEIANPLKVRFQLLQISSEILLYVLKSSEVDNVLVFKYQGIAGWVQVHQFTSDNAIEMEVLDFQLRNEYYGHLVLSSHTGTKVYAVRFKGKNYYDGGIVVKGNT